MQKMFLTKCITLSIKTPNKLDIEGNYLKIIKVVYDKSIVDTILNGEKLKDFLLRSGTRKGYIFTISIQYSTRSPSQSNLIRKINIGPLN